MTRTALSRSQASALAVHLHTLPTSIVLACPGMPPSGICAPCYCLRAGVPPSDVCSVANGMLNDPHGSQPLAGLAHLRTLPTLFRTRLLRMPPHLRPMLLCACARARHAPITAAASAAFTSSLSSWCGRACPIARALRLQLPHLAARDYDALSGLSLGH